MSKHRTIAIAVSALALLAIPATASAKSSDSDHDGMPTRWERTHHLSTSRNDARKDVDHDGLRNVAEYRAHTDPRDADTDDDGIKDGAEHAGTIASYDATTGVLTLTLATGSTVSGTVTPDTEISCGDSGRSSSTRHDGSDDQSGDNQGEDQGDDDGPNHDQGDDDGAQGSNSSCDATDLVAGAAIHQAEFRVTSTGTRFEEIELDAPAVATPAPAAK